MGSQGNECSGKSLRQFRTEEVKRHGPFLSVIADIPLKPAAVAFKSSLPPQKQVPVLGGDVSEVICTSPRQSWGRVPSHVQLPFFSARREQTGLTRFGAAGPLYANRRLVNSSPQSWGETFLDAACGPPSIGS